VLRVGQPDVTPCSGLPTGTAFITHAEPHQPSPHALAFASPGRLRGHVADDRDLFDMFEFQRAATSLLGAEIALYSDGAPE